MTLVQILAITPHLLLEQSPSLPPLWFHIASSMKSKPLNVELKAHRRSVYQACQPKTAFCYCGPQWVPPCVSFSTCVICSVSGWEGPFSRTPPYLSASLVSRPGTSGVLSKCARSSWNALDWVGWGIGEGGCWRLMSYRGCYAHCLQEMMCGARDQVLSGISS